MFRNWAAACLLDDLSAGRNGVVKIKLLVERLVIADSDAIARDLLATCFAVFVCHSISPQEILN
jgi:hypothetical protein